MKNLSSLIVIAIFFFMVSCSKETIELPQEETLSIVNTNESELVSSDIEASAQALPNMEAGFASVIIQIQVERVQTQEIAGEYLVDFSADYDFTGAVLENLQTLRFTNGSGNQSVLSFTVNNATGSNNNLSVAFAIGGNNLSGLDLILAQEIVIDDHIIN